MSSIFTKIIEGELPAYKIAEDDKFIAFLDINPLAEGHTLVVPKQEVDYIFDMEAELYADLWKFAQSIAWAIDLSIPCKRVGVAVIGLEVPHTHIHLVPLQEVSDINFSKPKLSFTKEEFEDTAAKIKEKLS